jgi:hypothetical protein
MTAALSPDDSTLVFVSTQGGFAKYGCSIWRRRTGLLAKLAPKFSAELVA